MTIERVKLLQDEVGKLGITAGILFYSRDVLYFTGTSQPAYFVIRPDKFRLFVRHGIEFVLRESFLPKDCIEETGNLKTIFHQMLPRGGAEEKVGTELDLLPVSEARRWQEFAKGLQLTNISGTILKLRMIKSPDEIKLISKACDVAHLGFLAASSLAQKNLTELEISAAIENAQRLAGHEGVIFLRKPDTVMGRGTFASGPNLLHPSGVLFTITGRGLSPAVPAGASKRRIKIGDLVLADISTCTFGYHADQSRMYSMGEPPSGSRILNQRLCQVVDHLVKYIRPGHSAGQVYDLAFSKAEELGLGQSFMAFPSGKKSHFVGHGVGLELDEPPLLSKNSPQLLSAGMVLAIEIHAYGPGDLVVKLEDTIHLNENGCQLLTQSPRQITSLM